MFYGDEPKIGIVSAARRAARRAGRPPRVRIPAHGGDFAATAAVDFRPVKADFCCGNLSRSSLTRVPLASAYKRFVPPQCFLRRHFQ